MIYALETEAGFLVLDESRNRYYLANGPALTLLRELDRGRSVEHLAEEVAERCQVSIDRVLEDYNSIMNSIRGSEES